MTQAILEFFRNLGGDQVILITIIVSMLPIIELKGAIPFGSSVKFWGDNALPLWFSFLISLLGTSIIAIVLIFAFKYIFKLLYKIKFTRPIMEWIDRKLNKHKTAIDGEVQKSTMSHRLRRAIAIFIFVAIPIPVTGVWTGSCLTSVLDMPIPDAIISVLLGNIVSGLIILFVSSRFPEYTHIVLAVMLVMAGTIIIVDAIHSHLQKKKEENTDTTQENDVVE